MLARRYRLRSRGDFNRLYKRGIQLRTQHLTIRSLPNRLPYSRLAVVVSTKINKRATVRNRLRRRLQSQVRELLPQLGAGRDLIITPQQDLSQLSTTDLTAELKRLLSKVE